MKKTIFVLTMSFIFALNIYSQDGKLEFINKTAVENGYIVTFIADKMTDENQLKLVLNDLLMKENIYDGKYILTIHKNVEFQIYTNDKISAEEVREVLLKNGLDFDFSTISVDGIVKNKNIVGSDVYYNVPTIPVNHKDFPKYEDTGNEQLDRKSYAKEKEKWINENPEEYQKLLDNLKLNTNDEIEKQ